MAAPRKNDPSPELTIEEVARRAFADASGDVDEAVGMFERAIRQSQRLRDALTEPLITSACREAINALVRKNRHSAWTGAEPRAPVRSAPPTAEAQASRVVQLASGTLLMFPLPGGKRLSEATREDVTEAATFYGRQAADMGVKARWLRLIAQSLPADKTVGEAITDKRLRELQTEAQRDA